MERLAPGSCFFHLNSEGAAGTYCHACLFVWGPDLRLHPCAARTLPTEVPPRPLCITAFADQVPSEDSENEKCVGLENRNEHILYVLTYICTCTSEAKCFITD